MHRNVERHRDQARTLGVLRRPLASPSRAGSSVRIIAVSSIATKPKRPSSRFVTWPVPLTSQVVERQIASLGDGDQRHGVARCDRGDEQVLG